MVINEMLKSRASRLASMPLLGATLAMHIVLAAGVPAYAGPMRTDLSQVRSWGYQLQHVDPLLVAASDYDLMVIDYSRDGTAEEAFSTDEVELMKHKQDGSSRIVLAYLSIGEAEDYRYYWRPEWSRTAPAWLEDENPDWPGNYPVRYWMPEWQSLIFGAPQSYIEAILAAGFDGVYLDRIDAFDVQDRQLKRSERMARMSDFVDALATYARQQRPGFVVVGQNAEELLRDARYADAIDGVGKEDLFFGLEGDGHRNGVAQLRASLTPLQAFQKSGKPVFVVEYVETDDSKKDARAKAAEVGMPLFIGDRELDDVRSR